LQYPDADVRARYGVVRAALASLTRSGPRDRLLDLVTELAATPAAELEPAYVRTFDRERRCCLYLTWWNDGETRRRGASLAVLKQLYRDRGVELLPGELPDYLPVVLEFAATVDLVAGRELLLQHRAGLELLRLALVEFGSPYAAALEAVCAMLPAATPRDAAAALALARNGPTFIPLESLGVRR
jgi:nitrate reductase molybdenum cofactor assembly chaperone NarJ/NarW